MGTARPVFTDLDLSVVDAMLSQQCGFPVQVHLQGKVIDTFIGETQMTRGAGYTVNATPSTRRPESVS